MVTRHRGYGGKREREPPHQDSTCIRDRIIGIVGRMVDRNERTGPGCSGSRRAGGGDSQRHGHLLRHKNGTGSDSASNGRLRDSLFFTTIMLGIAGALFLRNESAEAAASGRARYLAECSLEEYNINAGRKELGLPRLPSNYFCKW